MSTWTVHVHADTDPAPALGGERRAAGPSGDRRSRHESCISTLHMTSTRSRSVHVAVAACVIAAWMFSTAAGAQVDPRAMARKHFDRGIYLAHAGRYAEAIVEFDEAYQLSPHFAVLFNLGQAYAASGQPSQASRALRRYLVEGGAQIPADRRKQVEKEIARQEQRTARETADPAATAPPAGAPAPLPPLVSASPPPPAPSKPLPVSALPPPSPPIAPPALPVAASPASRPATLVEAAPTSSTGVPATGTSKPGMNGELIAGLTLGGLGIAAAGVATSLAIWNAGRYDDWSAANDRLSKGSNPPNPTDHAVEQQQNDDLARSIRATSWVTVSVGVASAALLTSGVVLYLRSRRANHSGEVTAAASSIVGIGPGSLSARWAF